MKKICLSLSFMLAIAVASATANDPAEISKEVQAAFKKEFPGSEVLNWNTIGEFSRATFLLDGHRIDAYFSEDGRLQGSIRTLFFNQLPLATMTAVDKRYAAAEVIEVYEITNDEGTNYRITLDSREKRFRVKVDANGNITQSEKLKK
jgi:hypothetical protein